MEPALISTEYLKTQIALHAAPRGYGGKGAKWSGRVSKYARQVRAASVLDYGCGQGSLGQMLRSMPLGLEVRDYDPAIPGKDALPAPADLVVCTDVLEHIEPDRLPAVLEHLRSMTLKALFVVISLRTAEKILCDGRNAHLIVESAAWWSTQLTAAGFVVIEAEPLESDKPRREWVAVLT